MIEAYAGGDRNAPNYRAVKHFTLESSAAQIVPPALRSYAHRKSKEEHDMEVLRSRASGLVATSAAAGGDDDGDEAPLGRRARAAASKAKAKLAAGKLTAAAAK